MENIKAFVELMNRVGIDQSDKAWASYEIVWEEATKATMSRLPEPFQRRVNPWILECFGAVIATDCRERNHRFFEEAAELVQACGMTASEAHQLVDYTWSRPVGEPNQEVGGVMVTLAALCLANGLDMHPAGETELARISQPDMVIRIRAKQATKPKHSPLPEHRASEQQAPAVEAAARYERAAPIRTALEWTAGTLQTLIKGRWRDVKESDRVSIGSAVKTISDVLDMADAVLTRASEAAKPMDDGARERIARALHYPACWDTAAYPTLESAVWESIACAKLGCSACDSASEAAAAIVQTDGARLYKHIDAEGNPYWLHTPPQAHAPGCGDGEDCNACDAMNAAAPQPASEQQAGREISDAAILACAFVINGICLTRPQDTWLKAIEARIRYMLAAKGDGHV